MNTDVDTLVNEARLQEAITLLEGQIRQHPADVGLRMHLFQLMCLTGQWNRAGQQIVALGNLNEKLAPTVLAYRGLVDAELYRKEVFAARATPMLIGEPDPWMAQWVQSAESAARGNFEEAAGLRQSALSASPATPFSIDGNRYDGLLDADTRMGPMLEVVLDGKYMWMPFVRAREVEVSPPECLADLVWARVRIVFSTRGEVSGFVPVRYPDTDASKDNLLRMSRSTSFEELPGNAAHGKGQRVLLTGEEELDLLRLGKAVFEEAT